MTTNRGPEPIGEIIDEWVRKTERESLGPTQRVGAAWRRIAAKRDIAKATRLAAFKRGSAVIEVTSPPLCAELAQFHRDTLLQELRRELDGEPGVQTLRFRLGAF